MEPTEPTPYAEEVQWRRDVKAFVRAIWNHWLGAVGGGVVATLMSLVASIWADVPKWIAVGWALCGAIVVACFLAWRDATRKGEALEEAIKPKLKCHCGRTVNGSRVETIRIHPRYGIKTPCIYFRMVLKNEGTSEMLNCRADITLIEKNGTPIMNCHTLPLRFYPATEQASVFYAKDTYLDILSIDSNGGMIDAVTGRKNAIQIETYKKPNSLPLDEMFNEPGTYHLTIVVTSPGNLPVIERVRFDWTGDIETAELSNFTV